MSLRHCEGSLLQSAVRKGDKGVQRSARFTAAVSSTADDEHTFELACLMMTTLLLLPWLLFLILVICLCSRGEKG